jgi:hypothetical protein
VRPAHIYSNAHQAMRDATNLYVTPRVVAWDAANKGWVVYHPTFPIPDVTPEVLCFRHGASKMFVPLSVEGAEIVYTLPDF